MTTRRHEPSVPELLEVMRQNEAQLTAERVRLAEQRTEREVPRELAAESFNGSGAVGCAVFAFLLLAGVALLLGGALALQAGRLPLAVTLGLPGGAVLWACLRAALGGGGR